MGKITGYATVGMVLALAKKMAIQYGALGIADVRTTPDGSDLIFIMSDGSQHRVELNFSANGVDYDDSVTKFNVNNVQAAIEALFSELQTNAGGLTVLRQSDFPLSADLLAKVKANPQNYCISYDSKMYYYERYNTSANKIFYLSNKSSGYSGIISQENLTIDDRSGIKVTSHNLIATLDNKTIGSSSEAPYLSLYIKGIEDTTDNTIKTGTEIRKAITIRKWH